MKVVNDFRLIRIGRAERRLARKLRKIRLFRLARMSREKLLTNRWEREDQGWGMFV